MYKSRYKCLLSANLSIWFYCIFVIGAVEKTRTSTPVKEQRPQRCASTNSATTALIRTCNRQVFRECEAEISTFFISLLPEPQARIPFKELRHMQKIERIICSAPLIKLNNLSKAWFRILKTIRPVIIAQKIRGNARPNSKYPIRLSA